MAVRIKRSLLRQALRELDNEYVLVKIPKLSLEILTDYYIEDIDTNSIKKQKKLTPQEFLGGEDTRLNGKARLRTTQQIYVTNYTYTEENSMIYHNGEPLKKSTLQLRDSYIPISYLIQIYNNGYTIKVPDTKTLLYIIRTLEKVLNNIEDSLTNSNSELLELLEDFYSAIIDGREERINYLLESEGLNNLKKSKSILSLGNKRLDRSLGNGQNVITRNGDNATIDLSDLIV